MAPPQHSLSRRIEDLEAQLLFADCRVCAGRPAIQIGGPTAPCPECGREPLAFTIRIDRTDLREDTP